MARRREIQCPYCGEKAELDNRRKERWIHHKVNCKLANAVDEPRKRVPDCPDSMLSVKHGMGF